LFDWLKLHCFVQFIQSASRKIAPLVGVVLILSFVLFSPAFAQPEAPIAELTLGESTQNRPITAMRVGNGPRKLVLVGATHGYPERNTYELVSQLADYFRTNPEEVPSALSLYFVPLLNPDGLELGVRQNANGVDLNRNMDTSADSCADNDWSQRVAGARGIISDTGGPYSESEAESRVIRDFLLDADGVIWFHSNAGVVFPACEHAPSIALARVFADSANYVFIPQWDRYPITGGMHDWAGGLGIASITPELVTGDLPELEQNLAGVKAVLNSAEGLLPLPQPHTAGGFDVQPIIWRAWTAWGGERIFGLPLGPPTQHADGWTQLFEHARFDYQPARMAPTTFVQLDSLGHRLFGTVISTPETPQADGRFFPETEHNISGLFAEFWQINGGLPIFGLPLSGEEQTVDDTDQPIVRQTFERAVLQRPLDSISAADVRLVPLGRIHWAQLDAQTPETSIRAR